MTTKIFLDPGHGGTDPGAFGNGHQESHVALEIAYEIKDILETEYEDVEVKLSRTGDTYPSFARRVNQARKWGADYFISIHLNAFNGSANGYEDYIHDSLDTNSLTAQYQQIMHDEIYKVVSELGNTPDRGIKKANFAVLRKTPMSAILTENLFIDSNGVDGEIIPKDEFVKATARGHTNGIEKIFNIKKTESGDKVSNQKPSEWAEDEWEESVAEGYFDGTNPKENMTRQQAAIVVQRLTDNIRQYEIEPLEKKIEELKKRVERLENRPE